MPVGQAARQHSRPPGEATGLVGRTTELHAIAQLLRASRLATLTGPGGVGKTRVAQRLAELTAPAYDDGVCLVRLSSLSDSKLLPNTVAHYLGLLEQQAGTPLEAVLAHLRDRRMLLVLDTCEHLIDACAELAEAILAEARESIRLATELGDERIAAQGYLFLNHALTLIGEFAEAEQVGLAAERLLTALDDRAGMLILTSHMAHTYQLMGSLDEANDWSERGLELLGPSRERWLSGWLHMIAGFTYLQQPGREADAARSLRLALIAKHELDQVIGIGFALEALAVLAWGAGRPRRACWLLGAADPLWRRLGARLSNHAPLEEMHKAVVAQIRGALGAAEFDALFAGAARFELDDMVAFAVNDADEPDGAVPPPPRPAALSLREREIAFLAAQGMTTAKIAKALFIAEPAAEAELARAREKLGVSRPELLIEWFGDNLLLQVPPGTRSWAH